MSLTDLPVDTAGNDIASARTRAIDAFLAQARGLLARSQDRAALQSVADALIALGQRKSLFPAAHFPIDAARPAQVYRLAEDVDGGFALYLSAGLAGKAQPPHDHTTWAVIAGVEGNERNVLYRREKTGDAARDALVQTGTVDVAAGSAVVLLPDDVHTIELVGGQDGRHLHFYGRALQLLDRRVVFEGTEGGSFRHFAPPKNIRHPAITPQALRAALADGEEIALLDVRETGVFVRSHILLAASAPLWRLEVLIDRLVPRRATRIVLADADESLAHEAAAKLVRLGWRNVSVLAGGTQGWAAAGYELFSGSNVPSKAFGEVIEHEKHTPWISVDDLHERVKRGDDIVVVDSRTPEEFADFSLPFAHSLPGAELVYRIQELAPRPETLVVVNCAGRTRSIVGAQTLIDAGIPNKVVSLKDGTMAWLLAGRELAHGRAAPLPEPGEQTRESARARAEDVAARAGVRRIDAETLARFEAEADERSLYRFDVRTRQEYEAGHLEGWRWAPGGQLVQATDEYVGTRHARIVLADWDGVRALTTGAWLAQLGGHEVFVLSPPALPVRVLGPEPVRVLSLREFTPDIAPREAAAALEAGTAVVFDVERRSAFERRHVAGARFAVPDRLQEFTADLPPSQAIVLTSSDGVLARTVAAELAARTGRTVRAIAGGTQAWSAARLPTSAGSEGVLTGDDDHWYSPYAHTDLAKRDAGFKQYLDWEIGLVAQLEREGDVGIRLVTPGGAAAS
ncbi:MULTISPECIES: rhodanese-like domain-containing protein [Variovorax]|jgi:rhodanese-related sulfurtransferase/predicted metal-dependent enzyme (double-stranded beta helix superfamily)|uniref:rhodanese-like domain-containing protein n=1 Tax=Variovorax TaxID=34072 RepID=UPI00086C6308|nr:MULTISPECIES: rhodanese-like domain-containing protein [Variovorax]MBN8758777.1 sulfurtransferase [Variovorax sp.]ODU19097.1 MAG: sulfurtransferase [Variovorax sp. SCN 67-85]ODV15468.1 MAG: sulfurtransferase [Variovorax sp. SCN 67-20]OJZ16107.1 MAG: sulfurtransferase [Variovorax sp. 67-131]UKI07554.1 sulfurtransferase [Variovorax paradoxus]